MSYSSTMKTNFKVEIDGIDYGNFTTVTGLGGTAEISDDIGGMDRRPRKLPGKVNFENVVLTRNCDPTDMKLRDWWKTVERGDKAAVRKAVSIVLFDITGTKEVARRNLFECIPCGWSMSDLNANENGLLTESLTIVYEDAEWK
jgi:phage tail-like protein